MLTLFKARSIITMNASQPRADAVLVRDGRIVEVGSQSNMDPWLDAYPHEVDDRFADAIITPGFIDPHLHPTMAAMILPMSFITALPWQLPWGDVPATTDAGNTSAHISGFGSRPKKDVKLANRPTPDTAATRNATFSTVEGSTPWP